MQLAKEKPAEAEAHYAKALELVTGQETFAKELACIMSLAKIYAQKRNKEALIQAAGLYNYALHLADRIHLQEEKTKILRSLDQIEAQILSICGTSSPTFSSFLACLWSGSLIEANKQNLLRRREKIDALIKELGKDPSHAGKRSL